jgi:hypothetical protein
MSEPSVESFGEARYTIDFAPTVDQELRPLVLAAAVLVDRAVVQVPTPT